LIEDTAAAESADKESPSLRQRLLSGPSAPGELLVLQGEPTAEQREQIEQRQPLQDAALKEDSALCK